MENYIQRIQDFNRDSRVMKLERMFDSSSILGIVGVERREIRHSRFIEWLFNQSEINTTGNSSPIMHLLDVIVRRKSQQFKESCGVLDNDFCSKVNTRSIRIESVRAEREIITKGVKLDDKSGSIDILITAQIIDREKKESESLAICIENKAYTDEHDDQTWKYYAFLKGNIDSSEELVCSFDETYVKPKYNRVIFVFLKPKSNVEMFDVENILKECKCPHYVHINYQDIVDYVLMPIMDNDETPDTILRHVKQYVDSLGLQDMDSKKKKKLGSIEMHEKDIEKGAMAYKEAVVELANVIWEDYKDDLFKLALIATEESNKLLYDFCNSHKYFFANLTSVIEMTTNNHSLWVDTQYYRKRLSGTKRYFVIEIDGKKNVYNQKDLAVMFAKKWVEANPNDNISVYNDKFKTIKGSKNGKKDNEKKLFSDSPLLKDNDSKTPLYDKISEEPSIYFENDCWNSGKNGKDGNVEKLINFINQNPLENFKILSNVAEDRV